VEALLVVEVLSPGSRRKDSVTKRYHHGRMGVPQYWIVDPQERKLHVMRREIGEPNYRDVATVEAGTEWRSEEPLPISLDPADFC
jgi:Uma2 family endonuclease